MSWNHRVIERTSEQGEIYSEIHEVCYTRKGRIKSWAVLAVDACGSDIDELRWTLENMLACLDKPVLRERKLRSGREVLEEK